jgi:hypothetical protein
MAPLMPTVVVCWDGKKVSMNNRPVLMRPVGPVRMFMFGMKVESRQKNKSGEEKGKNSPTPGW